MPDLLRYTDQVIARLSTAFGRRLALLQRKKTNLIIWTKTIPNVIPRSLAVSKRPLRFRVPPVVLASISPFGGREKN